MNIAGSAKGIGVGVGSNAATGVSISIRREVHRGRSETTNSRREV